MSWRHLKRRDDWSKLAQELVSVFFFFHPLVRWLLARLDRERELLCDEAVVALGTEPAWYARILFELARQSGRILSGSTKRNPVLLPFLDRRNVAIRISRLLEDDFVNTLSGRSGRRSLLLGGLAVTAALGVTGMRVREISRRRVAKNRQRPGLTRPGRVRHPAKLRVSSSTPTASPWPAPLSWPGSRVPIRQVAP